MFSVGRLAVMLARLRRIIPEVTIEGLRSRRVNVDLIDVYSARLTRFFYKMAGKRMLRLRNAERLKEDPAHLLEELRGSRVVESVHAPITCESA